MKIGKSRAQLFIYTAVVRVTFAENVKIRKFGNSSKKVNVKGEIVKIEIESEITATGL